jgi:CheY-like chemotaxis protein
MKKKKVLLVDDVRLFLKLEETFFRRTGCEIHTAQSGTEAMDIAREQQPDLILLDFIMPDMMGDEVVRKLKSHPETRTIPVMIVSTSADSKDVDRCFQAGADDYVTKPINPQEVLAKAANLLNIPHRLHYRLPVTMKVMGAAGNLSFISFSRNISLGGMLVESRDPVVCESVVMLELPILPGNQNLSLRGSVIRADEDASRGIVLLGIKFDALTEDQVSAIGEFIHKYESSAQA